MAGIVRRIDELGRIVIPKEIRHTMKIKTNDSLDINIEENKIVLKKYSDFYDIKLFLDNLITFLGSSIDKDIIIFDKNKIVVQYKCLFDNLLNKELNNKLLELLNVRKSYHEIKGNLEINKKCLSGNFLFSSIIPNGDVVGGILIYSEDIDFNDNDRFILELLNKTLTKYIEE